MDSENPALNPFEGESWSSKGRSSGQIRRKRRKPLGRRTRIIAWCALGLGTLGLLGVAWVCVTALLARGQLSAMRSELTSLRSSIAAGDIDSATSQAQTVASHASRAHMLTSGPAWAVIARIPSVGKPFEAARGAATAADVLGETTLPKLIEVSEAVNPSKLALRDHTVDIAALIAATPTLDNAVTVSDAQLSAVLALPKNTWLGPVNQGITEFSSSLTKLAGSLRSIDQAAHVAPALLGYTTPQRLFVGFQNEAELRGTGGLPGAFAIVVADQGKLTFTHFGSDGELEGVDSGLDFGAAYDATWGDYEPTKQYLNSSVDPDFRYAGQIWAAMWQKKSGEHVNGAIALDPTALSYLLAVSGPAAMPDGSQVNAGNIVSLTQSLAYQKFATDNNGRKAYLLQVASAAEQKILSSLPDPKATLKALQKSVSQRRIQIWSEDKNTEAILAGSNIGGTITDNTAPYANPVIINYAANKLDYYLDESVDYASRECRGTGNTTVTIKLTNNAPHTGLPTYVTQRTDNPTYPVHVGDNRVELYYVATEGAGLTAITVDGKQSYATPGNEGNHPVFSTLLELPAGQTVTVVLTLKEPLTTVGTVELPLQPHVRQSTSTVQFSGC